MTDENTSNETENATTQAADSASTSAATSEEAPAEERRKSPLEMIRERQAKQQASRSGIGKKGAKSTSQAGGAAGADGVLKPPQVKRQMGG